MDNIVLDQCMIFSLGYYFASQKNDLELVKALVVFDADVNSLNILKMSPMDHAFLHKNQV